MRRKSSSRDLPPRMLRRTKWMKGGKVWVSYYYNGRDKNGERKEFPLGPDLAKALQLWAKLEGETQLPAFPGTMAEVFNRYEREIVPTKKPETRRNNKYQLQRLRVAFGDAPIDAITSDDVDAYRKKRTARVQANREIALLSHVFTWAKKWKYTARERPTKDAEKNKEKPRNYYADDDVWDAVVTVASPELKFALELAYLTAQRNKDVIKMTVGDVVRERQHGHVLCVVQNKGDKPLRIRLYRDDGVLNDFGKLVFELVEVSTKKKCPNLISDSRGKPFSESSLRCLFNKARAEAVRLALASGDASLADRIGMFCFKDIRSKAATEIGDVDHASSLLNHSSRELTKRVYMRMGPLVNPVK